MSIIIAAIKLAMIGNLTPGTVAFIILSGILILVGNRVIFTITAAVAALILFLKVYGGDVAGQSALLQSLLTLVLVVFSLYVMLKGVLPAYRNRRRYKNKS